MKKSKEVKMEDLKVGDVVQDVKSGETFTPSIFEYQGLDDCGVGKFILIEGDHRYCEFNGFIVFAPGTTFYVSTNE